LSVKVAYIVENL